MIYTVWARVVWTLQVHLELSVLAKRARRGAARRSSAVLPAGLPVLEAGFVGQNDFWFGQGQYE